jgi:hypothetical protein
VGNEDGVDVRVGSYSGLRKWLGFIAVVLGTLGLVSIVSVFAAASGDGAATRNLFIQGGVALAVTALGFALLLSLRRRTLEVDRAARELRLRDEYYMCCRKGAVVETVPLALLGAMACTLHRTSANAQVSHVWVDVAYTGMTHALRLEDRVATGKENTLLLDWATYFALLAPGPVAPAKVLSGTFNASMGALKKGASSGALTKSASSGTLKKSGSSGIYEQQHPADARGGGGGGGGAQQPPGDVARYSSRKKYVQPIQRGVQYDRYGEDSDED